MGTECRERQRQDLLLDDLLVEPVRHPAGDQRQPIVGSGFPAVHHGGREERAHHRDLSGDLPLQSGLDPPQHHPRVARLPHPDRHRQAVALAIFAAIALPVAAPARPHQASSRRGPETLPQMDLGHTIAFGPWSMRAVNGPAGFGDWIPAEVPGCVHTDLLRAGKIPDPFYGTNEKALQWIERTDWEYRSTFVADAALLGRDRIELVFQGLDTFADVSVNGMRVLSADNMFRSWRADIKPRVVAGTNTVVVRFRSPIATTKPAYDRLGYTLPAVNDQAPEMVSMFARKAPYHYGWDWGPRFVTSGIWRPATIEAWDVARLDEVQVYQRALDDARARLEVAAV